MSDGKLQAMATIQWDVLPLCCFHFHIGSQYRQVLQTHDIIVGGDVNSLCFQADTTLLTNISYSQYLSFLH